MKGACDSLAEINQIATIMRRIQIDQVQPKAYKPLMALENYLEQSQLDVIHKNLIKIRASQLNGCTFCIDMHTKEAIEAGEDHRRIFLLNGWEKAGIFSEEEKVILQMTEEITMIYKYGLSENTYQKAVRLFDEDYIAQVIIAITSINSWNRIAVSTLKPLT